MLAVALTGCAHLPGGKPSATLRLTSNKSLNNCGKSVAYPLRYRIIQVTDPLPLAGLKLERLWDHEAELLGGGLVWRGPESVIEPDTTKTEKPIELDPRTRAVVVIGNFCKTRESCYYYVQPVAGKKSVVLDLTAGASCLTPTPR